MLKNSSFLFLLSGQAFSNFGDRLYMFAIITFIYNTTDSALLASVVPFIRLGMQFISSLLSPVVTQKMSLKSVLALSQLIQSILFLMLIFVLIRFEGDSFLFIVVIITLLSFLHSWIYPLKNALLPELVYQEQLVKANAMISILDQAFGLLGWVGGGLLISQLGPVNALWITFSFFVLSTGLFFLIRTATPNQLSRKRLSWSLIIEGWKYVIEQPLYRRVFLVGIVQSLAGSVWVGAIILVFVREILHKNDSWWGFLNGAWLLGTIVGGVVFSKWIQKNLLLSLACGLLLNGIMIIFFASFSLPLLSILFAFLIGVPYQIHDAAKRTILQLNAKTEKLAQIFAAYQAVSSVFFGIGIFSMNKLVDAVGVQTPYYLAAILTMFAAWVALGVRKVS